MAGIGASKTSRNSRVCLFNPAAETNAVAWSQDQRIAVTAAEAIYVLVGYYFLHIYGGVSSSTFLRVSGRI